jgi:hypothetical protein
LTPKTRISSSDRVADLLLERAQLELGPRRGLVGIVDAGQPGQLAGAGARVKALRVAALALLERRVHVHLDEAQAVGLVPLADPPAIGGVGRHERGQRHEPRVGEEPRHLARSAHVLRAVLR